MSRLRENLPLLRQYDRICKQFSQLKTLITITPIVDFEQAVCDVWQLLYTGETKLAVGSTTLDEGVDTIVASKAFKSLQQSATGDLLMTTIATWRFSYVLAEWLERKEEHPSDEEDDLAEQLDKEMEDIMQMTKGVEHMLSGLSQVIDHGDRHQMPIQQQLQLATEIYENPELEKMADFAHRFKLSARMMKKSRRVETILKKGQTFGKAPERLLPIEYLKSESDEASLDFLRRFAEGQTRMYDYKTRNVDRKGAFIVCYDESSSMQQLDVQGKGFVLALLALAKKEKRDFVFIPFSGAVSERDVLVFKKGKHSVNELLQLSKSYIGGGTNFEAPLKKALTFVDTSVKDGDIVFITDGECHISDAFIDTFNTMKKKKQFELLTIIVGPNKHDGYLPEISNRIVHIQQFTDEAGQIAFTL